MRTWIVGLALVGMTACTRSVQTISGKDYIARYENRYPLAVARCGSETDADILQIAAIEPDLVLPARIGLARIGPYGDLISPPAAELDIWTDFAEAYGSGAGEFVPISP